MVIKFKDLMYPKLREPTKIEKIQYYITYFLLSTSLTSFFSILILLGQSYSEPMFLIVSSVFTMLFVLFFIKIVNNYRKYGELVLVRTHKKQSHFISVVTIITSILLTIFLSWSVFENIGISYNINTMHNTLKKEEITTSGLQVGICSSTPFSNAENKTKEICVAKSPNFYKNKTGYALYAKYADGKEEIILYKEEKPNELKEMKKIDVK